MKLITCMVCGNVRAKVYVTNYLINEEKGYKYLEIKPCPVCGETKLFETYKVVDAIEIEDN